MTAIPHTHTADQQDDANSAIERVIAPTVALHVRQGTDPERTARSIHGALDSHGYAADLVLIHDAVANLMCGPYSAQEIIDAVIEAEAVL